MLKQRIITALLLLAVALPALFHSNPQWLGGFGLVLILAAAWEWGRLNGLLLRPALVMSLVCGLVCALFYAAFWMTADNGLWGALVGRNTWLMVGASWVLFGAYLVRGGTASWHALPQWLRLLLGVLVLCSTWLALYQAKLMGSAFLLSCLALVWIADIAAYFAGRRWGRRKLALHISPGKSWEGVWSGMVVVLLVGGLWVLADRHWKVDSPSLYSVIFSGLGVLGMMLMTVFLTAMGVVGDLTESLVKRNAGAKDSSGLLPGHGGVLDRVDALLPVFPMAVALGALT